MAQVSVIIPSYNDAVHLPESIESALGQTYEDLEVIVVDDGSTDNTRQVVEAVRDERLRYIHQANQGLSAARNRGILASTGLLLAFLDSDDLILPSKLERQASLLAANPEYGVAYCDSCAFDGDDREHWLLRIMPCPSGDVLADLVRGNFVTVHAALVRRGCLDQVGLFDEGLRAVEDWDLWLRMAHAGIRFLHHSEVLALYRRRVGSMSTDHERQIHNEVDVLLRFAAYAGDDALLAQLGWQEQVARRYFLWALIAYCQDRPVEGRQHLFDAAAYDRGWLEEGSAPAALLADRTRERGTALCAKEAEDFVTRVCCDLRELLPDAAVQRIRRQALSLYWSAEAFESHAAGDGPGVRRSVWQAARAHPGTLRNLGLSSILIQSVIGRQVWEHSKPWRRKVVRSDP